MTGTAKKVSQEEEEEEGEVRIFFFFCGDDFSLQCFNAAREKGLDVMCFLHKPLGLIFCFYYL